MNRNNPMKRINRLCIKFCPHQTICLGATWAIYTCCTHRVFFKKKKKLQSPQSPQKEAYHRLHAQTF